MGSSASSNMSCGGGPAGPLFKTLTNSGSGLKNIGTS